MTGDIQHRDLFVSGRWGGAVCKVERHVRDEGREGRESGKRSAQGRKKKVGIGVIATRLGRGKRRCAFGVPVCLQWPFKRISVSASCVMSWQERLGCALTQNIQCSLFILTVRDRASSVGDAVVGVSPALSPDISPRGTRRPVDDAVRWSARLRVRSHCPRCVAPPCDFHSALPRPSRARRSHARTSNDLILSTYPAVGAAPRRRHHWRLSTSVRSATKTRCKARYLQLRLHRNNSPRLSPDRSEAATWPDHLRRG